MRNNKIDTLLNEFVDEDGNPIKGNVPSTTDQISVGAGETGELYSKQALPARDYFWTSFRSSPWLTIQAINSSDDTLDLNENKSKIIKTKSEILEDFLSTKKEINQELLNSGKIPQIDALRISNPDIVISAENFLNQVSKCSLDQTEKVILIAYILSRLNTENINPEYKTILKNKI